MRERDKPFVMGQAEFRKKFLAGEQPLYEEELRQKKAELPGARAAAEEITKTERLAAWAGQDWLSNKGDVRKFEEIKKIIALMERHGGKGVYKGDSENWGQANYWIQPIVNTVYVPYPAD
jgi:hypothetical protein